MKIVWLYHRISINETLINNEITVITGVGNNNSEINMVTRIIFMLVLRGYISTYYYYYYFI